MLDLPGFDFGSIDAVRAELPAAAISRRCCRTRHACDRIAPADAGDTPERIADVPIYASDPLVRRAPSLQKTRNARRLPWFASIRRPWRGCGSPMATRCACASGGGEAMLKVVADAGVPDGCVRIAAGASATSMLGPMFGPIAVEAV